MPEQDPAPAAAQADGAAPPTSALDTAIRTLQEHFPGAPPASVSSVAQAVADACGQLGLTDSVRAIASQRSATQPTGANIAFVDDSGEPGKRLVLPLTAGLEGVRDALSKVSEVLPRLADQLSQGLEQANEAAAKHIRQ